MPDRDVSNGAFVEPVMECGYAVVTHHWKAGDKIAPSVPMKVAAGQQDISEPPPAPRPATIRAPRLK